MTPDRPDFFKSAVQWSQRDWSYKEYEGKTFYFASATPFDPGETRTMIDYTVPAGKALYLTDIICGAKFRVKMDWEVVDVGVQTTLYHEPYDSMPTSFSCPALIPAGFRMKMIGTNEDIVSDHCSGVIWGWEGSASEPEKPKNDDPRELYRCGEFNHCNTFASKDGEMLLIFGKHKSDKKSYLKVKNLGSPNEKKIASFHLKGKEATEIINTTHASPQKVKAVLEKYERKYAKIKIR